MKAACSAWRRHLAEPLVAFDTRNPPGQRLIDSRLLNVVLVLMLTTSMLGPVLSERFAPRLLNERSPIITANWLVGQQQPLDAADRRWWWQNCQVW